MSADRPIGAYASDLDRRHRVRTLDVWTPQISHPRYTTRARAHTASPRSLASWTQRWLACPPRRSVRGSSVIDPNVALAALRCDILSCAPLLPQAPSNDEPRAVGRWPLTATGGSKTAPSRLFNLAKRYGRLPAGHRNRNGEFRRKNEFTNFGVQHVLSRRPR